MDPKTGRCAILFPHGVLFRDEEQEMRQCIVEADLIEAVIGLGPNLFYNSPMESCIVICRSKKPAKRSGKVLFIDAVNEVTRERAQSFLTPEHIDRVVSAFQAFDSEEGFAAVETLGAIADRSGNLSIPLYVTRRNDGADHDLEGSIAAWRQSAVELRTAAENLFDHLDAGVSQ
jgi:type I restriction enzyme M protein